MRKKLLVSFSGGETSAYMGLWLWKHKQDEYDMVFVFANTGQENEETLQFIHKFELHFGIPIVWIEAVVYHGKRKSNGFKVVDYKSADRDGKVFEEIIKKHGIPNMSFPHCTREMKQAPIKSYAKSLGWKKYYTAIGIRSDEMDRQNAKAEKNRFVYPLISKDMQPMTKPKINFFWSQQDFRLDLKGYQGNCITCWKKSDHKLYTIAKESEKSFIFMHKMEERYKKFTPPTRLKLMSERGEYPVYPIVFFRKNRSALQIVEESKTYDGTVKDDAQNYDLDGEACEVFSGCDDNRVIDKAQYSDDYYKKSKKLSAKHEREDNISREEVRKRKK